MADVRPVNPIQLGRLQRRPPPQVPREDALRVPRGELSAAQPEGANPTSNLIRLPGADYPPADAIAFDQTGDADVAPGATGTLLTVTIPDQYLFRWSGIGFGADDETALGFLTWSIFASPPGAVVPSYVGMAASVGSIDQLSYMFLVYGANTVLTVLATSSAPVGTYHFVVRAQGWFYSQQKEQG